MRDDCDYEETNRDFFALPFNLNFAEVKPIRQNGYGLSGYRIQNTPFKDDDSDDDDEYVN